MAFTYDPTTARGRVRLLVSDTNDTDSTKQVFTDAEVDAFLALEGQEVYMAAAAACRALAASTAKSALAYKALDLSIDKKDIPGHFRGLADDYANRARSEPTEYVDSADFEIDGFGRDTSEYVGDVIT